MRLVNAHGSVTRCEMYIWSKKLENITCDVYMCETIELVVIVETRACVSA